MVPILQKGQCEVNSAVTTGVCAGVARNGNIRAGQDCLEVLVALVAWVMVRKRLVYNKALF